VGERSYTGGSLLHFLRPAGHVIDGLACGLYAGRGLTPGHEDIWCPACGRRRGTAIAIPPGDMYGC
jgi:hypothetical protein